MNIAYVFGMSIGTHYNPVLQLLDRLPISDDMQPKAYARHVFYMFLNVGQIYDAIVIVSRDNTQLVFGRGELM